VTTRPIDQKIDEAGYSGLLEMVTVLLLLGLILGTVYSTIFSSQNNVVTTTERLRNLDEARTIMAAATKDVRTAVRLEAGTSPFLRADAKEAVFYANLDTTDAPKLVQVYIDASDRLIERVWTADTGTTAPDYTYAGVAYPGIPTTCGSTCTVRLVGHYVANTTAEPLFEYLDEADNTISPTPLSSTNRLAIDAVRISLRVKRDSGLAVNTTTIVNRVRLPNVDYNAVAGG
jgi:hypothetical protein